MNLALQNLAAEMSLPDGENRATAETTTQAEHYFFKWEEDPISAFNFIADQIASGDPVLIENEWLDFKEAAPLWYQNGQSVEKQSRRDKVRKQFAELLSAFSNTSGGLLIWGVRSPHRIPECLSLACDVNELKVLSESMVRELTDPPVLGVRCLALPNPIRTTEGILVVFVPLSRHRPHRATVGERIFFMRVQDSCDPIPTSMLRTMFYPQIEPFCQIESSLSLSMKKSESTFNVRLNFSIKNRGSGSAEDLASTSTSLN